MVWSEARGTNEVSAGTSWRTAVGLRRSRSLHHAIGMTYFAIKMRDHDGIVEPLGLLQFASLEEAELDVQAAIPDLVADLLRSRISPQRHAFLICDEDDRVLLEVPVGELLHPPDGYGSAPRADRRAR